MSASPFKTSGFVALAWRMFPVGIVLFLLLWATPVQAGPVTVVLKSGETIQVELLEVKLGESVRVRLADGEEQILPWMAFEWIEAPAFDYPLELNSPPTVKLSTTGAKERSVILHSLEFNDSARISSGFGDVTRLPWTRIADLRLPLLARGHKGTLTPTVGPLVKVEVLEILFGQSVRVRMPGGEHKLLKWGDVSSLTFSDAYAQKYELEVAGLSTSICQFQSAGRGEGGDSYFYTTLKDGRSMIFGSKAFKLKKLEKPAAVQEDESDTKKDLAEPKSDETKAAQIAYLQQRAVQIWEKENESQAEYASQLRDWREEVQSVGTQQRAGGVILILLSQGALVPGIVGIVNDWENRAGAVALISVGALTFTLGVILLATTPNANAILKKQSETAQRAASGTLWQF